jgi:hypothetical protein
MNDMDAFEELGITTVATSPTVPTTGRTVGEAVTPVVAGTALLACGIAAAAFVAIVAVIFSAP